MLGTTVILAAYASLLLELTLVHVRSTASSLQLWAPDAELVGTYSPRYRRLFALGRPTKALLFIAPLLVVYATFLYPLVVVVVAGRDPIGDYLFTPSPGLTTVGLGLLLVGRGIAVVSALSIRRHNAQSGDSFRLHTAGLFRWSRNPGLLGMYLFIGGIWLTMPSALMLAGMLFYVLYMHFKVRMEEDFLANRFGEPYLAYRAKTRRYVPC